MKYLSSNQKYIKKVWATSAISGICAGAGLICFLDELTSRDGEMGTLMILSMVIITALYKIAKLLKEMTADSF